jgi:Protein of unknown function (DUF3592)
MLRRLVGTLFLLAGGALIAVAIAVTVDNILFLRGSSETAGVIRSVREDRSADFENFIDGLYIARTSYTSEDGPELEDIGVQGLVVGDPPYTRGDEVQVVYDPEQPTDARIDTFMGLWLLPLGEAVIGLVVAYLGLLLIRR